MTDPTTHAFAPSDLAAAVGGRWQRDPTRPIRGASIDTRALDEGAIFVALKGERTDGHRFLEQAAEAGASCAIIDDPSASAPDSLGLLLVRDAREALADAARVWRTKLAGPVIAITGSNGKTTTVAMLHAALRAGGMTGTRSIRSFNNDLGVPLTLLNAAPGHDYTICECGINAPGEMGVLGSICAPDIAVITSIGRAHLEALGSIEGIAREKSALIRAMRDPAARFAVAPAGVPTLDPFLHDAARAGTRVIRFGRRQTEPVHVIAWNDGDRVTASINTADWSVEANLPMPGIHNAWNAAAAAIVARELGVGPRDIAAGLAQTEPAAMRLEIRDIDLHGGTARLVLDAYNANPDSMTAALDQLAAGAFDPPEGAGRRVAILGEMLELGDAAQHEHTELTRRVTRHLTAGDLHAATLIGPSMPIIDPRITIERGASEDTLARAAAAVIPGDVALLKASRSLRFERIAEMVTHQSAGTGP